MPPNEPSARPSVVTATGCAALLIALHVASRACRDALFLSSFAASELPKVMLASAAVGLPVVFGVSRAMTRVGPGRLMPAVLVASAALHALEWVLLDTAANVAVILLYVHASIATGLAVSGLWSVVNEVFDPHTVRRVARSLAIASAAGGLFGGIFARQLGSTFGPAALLPALVAFSLLGALLLGVLGRGSQAAEASDGAVTDFAVVTRSPYLRSIATLVVLTGLSSAVVDFCFKTQVSATYLSETQLVSFFALFYTATSVASVALQLSVARWALAGLGLGLSLAALPVSVLAFGALGVALPSAWIFVLLRGSGIALETSLYRSAYEPLYAPLPMREKRSAKTLVDVACDRLGEAAGSGAMLALSVLIPVAASRFGLLVAVLSASACIWLSLRLERGYVGELAQSLKSGRLRLDAGDVNDATTRLTMSQTQLEIDRDALLRQIAELRGRGGSETGGASASLPPRAPGLSERIAALQSDDPALVREALAGAPLEPELVSFVIPLLEHDATADAAIQALRKVAPKIVGQLVDALLDRERPVRLRRRIPRVLRVHSHPRVVRGLSEVLADEEFELRYRAGIALRELARTDSSLRPAQSIVLEAAAREVEASHVVWRARTQALVADEEAEGETGPALPDRALDHVFTLLALAFDADAVELARRALSTKDWRLRGTALEYLEHVVPEPIRAGIWPYLQAGRLPRQARVRSPHEIVDELKRSFG